MTEARQERREPMGRYWHPREDSWLLTSKTQAASELRAMIGAGTNRNEKM
jgi:hypothetical protein